MTTICIRVLRIILAIRKVWFRHSISTAPVDASMDSPNSATSEELFTMFKELSEAFGKFMIWLFTVLAVKATDTGNALLVKHSGFLKAAVFASFVNLLVFDLATVLQLNAKTRSLIPVLVLGSSVPILASFVISWAIGWLTLSLWLCAFAIVVFVIMKIPSN